ANILECEITKLKAGLASVDVGKVSLTLPSRGLAIGKALLGVRPNRLLITKKGVKNSLPGKISRLTYVGNHLEYTLKTDHGELFVISTDVDTNLKVGASVGIAFAQKGPVLLPH
ncbi:MAG: TOBE domain-containing protein, partial [Rhizobiaceae bacterium]